MKNIIPFLSVTVAAMCIGLGEALPLLPLVCHNQKLEIQNKLGPGQILKYRWGSPMVESGELKFNAKHNYDTGGGNPKTLIFSIYKGSSPLDRYSILAITSFSNLPCKKGLLSFVAKNDGLYIEENGNTAKFVSKWKKFP
ncbi:unnamed protein product [Brassica rapa]|uniref:Uncharacterized protein n=1 Tax=Brassica campestris TaxID=3711 RepID=A0A8D9G873_BRACM|nr:unnamed protein product [Brassica rapa]